MSDRRLRAGFVVVMVLLGAFWPPRLDVAHAETAGVIYVVNQFCCLDNHGGVVRIDKDGNQTMVSEGKNFQSPVGMAQAPDGTIYVVDRTSNSGHGVVFKIDPT